MQHNYLHSTLNYCPHTYNNIPDGPQHNRNYKLKCNTCPRGLQENVTTLAVLLKLALYIPIKQHNPLFEPYCLSCNQKKPLNLMSVSEQSGRSDMSVL